MEDAHVLQLKNRKFSDLYLCFCGYAQCHPCTASALRSDPIIFFIIS